jgi:hypothetical protein
MDEMPAWNQKISDYPARYLTEHEALQRKLDFGPVVVLSDKGS